MSMGLIKFAGLLKTTDKHDNNCHLIQDKEHKAEYSKG